jgi:hypothetical protein
MVKQSKALRRYLRQVKRALPCSNTLKKQVLTALCNDVSLYLEEHPDTNEDTLTKVFGVPAQIAQTYIDELPTTELMEKLHDRKKLRRAVIAIVGACALLCVLLWGGAVLAALREVQERTDPYYEIIIEEGK